MQQAEGTRRSSEHHRRDLILENPSSPEPRHRLCTASVRIWPKPRYAHVRAPFGPTFGEHRSFKCLFCRGKLWDKVSISIPRRADRKLIGNHLNPLKSDGYRKCDSNRAPALECLWTPVPGILMDTLSSNNC